jgi:hypothetical protein
VVEDQAQDKGNPIVGVGWGGANRSGQAVVGRSSTAVWIGGHRWDSSGRGWTLWLCCSPQGGGMVGGGRVVAVYSGQLTEEEAVGDGAPPGVVVGSLSCNRVLEEEGVEAVPLVQSDGDGMGWWWPAMAKSKVTVIAERSGA